MERALLPGGVFWSRLRWRCFGDFDSCFRQAGPAVRYVKTKRMTQLWEHPVSVNVYSMYLACQLACHARTPHAQATSTIRAQSSHKRCHSLTSQKRSSASVTSPVLGTKVQQDSLTDQLTSSQSEELDDSWVMTLIRRPMMGYQSSIR